jgi:hypothetical protein
MVSAVVSTAFTAVLQVFACKGVLSWFILLSRIFTRPLVPVAQSQQVTPLCSAGMETTKGYRERHNLLNSGQRESLLSYYYTEI